MQGFQSPERTPFSEITLEMEADKETEIWYAMRATYRRAVSYTHLDVYKRQVMNESDENMTAYVRYRLEKALL